jgi:hypothetical protein
VKIASWFWAFTVFTDRAAEDEAGTAVCERCDAVVEFPVVGHGSGRAGLNKSELELSDFEVIIAFM